MRGGGGGGAGSLPLAAIVGIAAAAAAVVGTVAGVALAVHCRRRRAARAEERQRAFEAVFSDPELELEEVAAEVRRPHGGTRCQIRIRGGVGLFLDPELLEEVAAEVHNHTAVVVVRSGLRVVLWVVLKP